MLNVRKTISVHSKSVLVLTYLITAHKIVSKKYREPFVSPPFRPLEQEKINDFINMNDSDKKLF